MAENVIVGINECCKEQIKEFVIRKYSPPGIKDYEVMKTHYHPPESYIDAIASLITAFDGAALEQRAHVLVELIGFVISGRKAHLEGEIISYAEKGPISHNSAVTLSDLLVVMRYTHDVGSKESLGNLLDAIDKLK